jgi:hypothetical protein
MIFVAAAPLGQRGNKKKRGFCKVKLELLFDRVTGMVCLYLVEGGVMF